MSACRRSSWRNGFGGFCDNGRTYAIVLEGDQDTPAPWVNVIANRQFGTILSASGSAHTWSENSRENRLTPFANDPVIDQGGEAFFIRDDDTGRRLVADTGTDAAHSRQRTLPGAPHGGRHAGFHAPTRASTISSMCSSMPTIRCSIAHLTLVNTGRTQRHLSVFAYNDWVIGPPRELDAGHVITDFDAAHNAVLARNPYNTTFAGRVVLCRVERAR